MTNTTEKEKESEYKKGLWTEEEDKLLSDYVKVHGKGQWNRIAKKTGLKRCGKSCRLRWMNYLSPSVNRSSFTEEEEDLIIRLHKLLGNRWSLIAKRVPGRTDNQVKNYWNTHLSKKLGIKGQPRRVADSSGLLNSRKVDVCESSVTETCTACDKNTSSATTHILVDNKGAQKAVNVSDTQESIMDEGFFNSLWVSNDDLMEFTDSSYSLI